MPTPISLNGIVLSAQHRAFNEFSTVAGSESAGVDRVRDTLIKAGWTYLSDVKATCTLFAPFGWGYTGFQANVVTISGTHFVFYDPRFDDTPSGPNVYPVDNASGSSPGAQANLASAISSVGFSVSIVDEFSLLMTSTLEGTHGNDIPVQAQGSISVAPAATSGGGWVLESLSQFIEYGIGNSYKLRLTVRNGAPSGTTQILAEVIGKASVPYFMGQGTWKLYANEFTAYFREIAFHETFDIYGNNNFIWASLLLVPDIFPSVDCGFIAQGNGFPTSLGQGNAFNIVVTVANNVVFSTQQGQGGWSINIYHNETETILDVVRRGLLQPALVSMPCEAGEARILGCIPDAFMTSEVVTLEQQVFMGNVYYRSIEASATPTTGTLFLGTGEAHGNPVAPPATPQFAVGIGNIDVTGGVLTRQSGDSWTGVHIGSTVKILFDNSTHTVTGISGNTLTMVPPGPTNTQSLIQISI